jgi:hypothetical protein
MRLSEISKKELGDCFRAAGKFMLNHSHLPGIKLVHAFVNGNGKLQGKRFPHAWIEIGDAVIDNSNGNNIVTRVDPYYKQLEVKKQKGQYAAYTSEEALKHFAKDQHWGPWDLDE